MFRRSLIALVLFAPLSCNESLPATKPVLRDVVAPLEARLKVVEVASTRARLALEVDRRAELGPVTVSLALPDGTQLLRGEKTFTLPDSVTTVELEISYVEPPAEPVLAEVRVRTDDFGFTAKLVGHLRTTPEKPSSLPVATASSIRLNGVETGPAVEMGRAQPESTRPPAVNPVLGN